MSRGGSGKENSDPVSGIRIYPGTGRDTGPPSDGGPDLSSPPRGRSGVITGGRVVTDHVTVPGVRDLRVSRDVDPPTSSRSGFGP